MAVRYEIDVCRTAVGLIIHRVCVSFTVRLANGGKDWKMLSIAQRS